MKIKGKAKKVSREFIRSWASAAACVLNHHGYYIDLSTLSIKVCDLSKEQVKLTGETGAAGQAAPALNRIHLEKRNSKQEMARSILHEMIHIGAWGNNIAAGFGENTDEKCTSTLNARLQPQVAKLAQILINGTYERAAYFAHTKLSYRTDKDHYDEAEHATSIKTKDKYKKQRSSHAVATEVAGSHSFTRITPNGK